MSGWVADWQAVKLCYARPYAVSYTLFAVRLYKV